VPQKELDIQTLQKSYHAAQVHRYKPGRKVKRKNMVKDVTTMGAVDMSKTVNRWVEGRNFTRSMTQEWDLFSESEGSEMDCSDT
jgi:hypothetical protein